MARMVAASGRHGEAQAESLSAGFAREVNQRAQTVNEAPKSENNVNTDSGGGSAAWMLLGGKKKGKDEPEKEPPGHPTKGKLLDIQGA